MIRHEKKTEDTAHEEGARAVQRSLDRRDHGGAETTAAGTSGQD